MAVHNNSLRKSSRGFSATAELVILTKVSVSEHPDVLCRPLCVSSLQRQSVKAFVKLSITLYKRIRHFAQLLVSTTFGYRDLWPPLSRSGDAHAYSSKVVDTNG